ncbi:MAG: methylmalonyl-CoA mutase family protein [Beijerinckiaceae bacterium]|nr:methylmalonyl-CoA mutase family protein [Beijerinckiaceae bacterium]
MPEPMPESMPEAPDFAPIASAFPTVSDAQWRGLVDKALKGAPFERLVSRTADGIEIQPLYQRDTLSRAPVARAHSGPWHALTRIEHPDAAIAATQASADLEGGAAGLSLVFAGARNAYGFGLPAGSARDVLALDLKDAALSLNIPTQSTAPEDVAHVIESQGLDPASAQVFFGLAATDDTSRIKALMARGFGGPFIAADGRLIHAAGGTDAQELAFALAEAVAALRALEAAGLSLDDARRAIGFRMAVDADQFASICKLRALRRLWARVEESCGLHPLPAHVEAETAWRMMTRRDPYVNALRTTTAAFAAGVAGADAVVALPFTQALGLPDAQARRLARNAQLILIEEANLWRVADPAAGAGGFEALTDALAQKAWTLFQEIEGEGGLAASLSSGVFAARVKQARQTLERDVARRKLPITGTSEYPNLGEAPVVTLAPLPTTLISSDPLAPMRMTEAFETLRDASDVDLAAKGARPRVFLATLGDVASAAARLSFARALFEAGGFQTLESAGLMDASAAAAAFQASNATFACLCGPDAAYESLAAAVASALKGAGARSVWIAGRPGETEAAWRAAGVDGFVFAGCDAVAALRQAWAVV